MFNDKLPTPEAANLRTASRIGLWLEAKILNS
jgi:hypothetical protein